MSQESKFTIACRLAQFLRRNGDKVINGSCKLSLTTSALCLLNTLFAEVLNQEWPGNLNLSIPDALNIPEDVQFLYDFMKRTSSLKLFHGAQTLRGGVDLSHFSNLTVLELRKIPAHLIIGLDSLSVQLKALICSRSIYLLKELFGASVDEQCATNIWIELKELNLSSNYLESLDKSVRCLPNVEVLDLSHNHIKNTEKIQGLKNLSFVNLSYNELDHLPSFNISSCRSLTKLYLRNNNLEDLDGLDCLFNLEDLDVGYNLMSEYHVLCPLNKLKYLRRLNLEGNPLFFHNRHSVLVATYINQNVLCQGIYLNGKLLSRSLDLPLQSNVNNLCERRPSNHHQTSINAVVGDAESIINIPNTYDHLSRSERSHCDDNSSVSSLTSQSGTEQVAVLTQKTGIKTQRRKLKGGKKTHNMREVVINEVNGLIHEKLPKACDNIGTVVPSHIQAKEQMEARRLERGETWLIPDNCFQRFLLPSPQVPSNTPVFSSIVPPFILMLFLYLCCTLFIQTNLMDGFLFYDCK